MASMLYTNEKGDLLAAPALRMAAARGSEILLPSDDALFPLPEGATLTALPGRVPLGFDGRGRAVPLEKNGLWPVAALLPQGFTRTLLPAYTGGGAEILPLLGYTAVGMRDGRVVAAAIPTDDHQMWHPKHYNTAELPARVKRMKRRFPRNRLVAHLGHCSLEYGCFTAQNIFYHRWEGGLPVSPHCNAACLGCISRQPAECCPSPQGRIRFRPEPNEVGELGSYHLLAKAAPIVSFGQGCEGEPSLAADLIAKSIARMRRETDRGTVNINTNGGDFGKMKKIVDSGLNAMRVSLISAKESHYNAYYRAKGYCLADVEKTIAYGVENGLRVSLNLLTLPGFNDREEEIEALLALVRRTGLSFVQIRNLNIDDAFFYRQMPLSPEPSLGIEALLAALAAENVTVGNYSRPSA